MSTITITSRHIDDLNQIYKRLKKDYKAIDTIKLNDQNTYELKLQKSELDPSLKAICNKVLDSNSFLQEEGESAFDGLGKEDLQQSLENEAVNVIFRPLSSVWPEINSEKKFACLQYLFDHKDADLTEVD